MYRLKLPLTNYNYSKRDAFYKTRVCQSKKKEMHSNLSQSYQQKFKGHFSNYFSPIP